MSDDNQANKNYYRRLQAEYAELDDPIVKGQMALDHWWESQRDLAEEENDWVTIGGFRERRSAMPSFHRGRRDSDWRMRR
jgi:hypothetical protein